MFQTQEKFQLQLLISFLQFLNLILRRLKRYRLKDVIASVMVALQILKVQTQLFNGLFHLFNVLFDFIEMAEIEAGD